MSHIGDQVTVAYSLRGQTVIERAVTVAAAPVGLGPPALVAEGVSATATPGGARPVR